MKYFIDTEFNEHQDTIQLMSIALVAEDGRELYAVNSDFDPEQCNNWVRANVLPKLPPRSEWITTAQIASRVREFVYDAPTFWGYFADYDWVLFCWLFGAMIDLPHGWPMFCLDLKQSMAERRIAREQLPKLNPNVAHDALEDARWLRDSHHVVYGGNSQ